MDVKSRYARQHGRKFPAGRNGVSPFVVELIWFALEWFLREGEDSVIVDGLCGLSALRRFVVQAGG